ncbi:hypothetical protein [Mesobacillus selenatarsenatis]|uniref:Uncharacterized protein n=1 Tax=Mesobacillus selenatarsenatis (strain DSM 18680 / JCM 14380 / FERM P-15431 / SF-1) TaxID=1321606 RepID=A0A0A8WY35_MESS1|nr:hypothetical protein [Mesobacillus selenatarsenatis]GAM12625.1 hypothetical protein SAMD00020551_0760 [Mesobacillus selenatarsenatis SF-1]
MHNQTDSIEKLLVSLIKMVGKNNEKVDELTKRVRQLEIASKDLQINRVYSFIAEPPRPNSSRKEYART